MLAYNFINFIHIVDLSLLNFIDYSDILEGSCLYQDDNKLHLTLNAKTKKFLTSFIVDNINNSLHYGKINIVINTCKPMKNWRQVIRKAAVRNNKYCVIDDSLYIDELKLNSFADAIFQKLPKLDLNKVNKETQELGKEVLKLNPNVNYLSFNDIDLYDANNLAKSLLTNIGALTFDSVIYNLIQDGNDVYAHASDIPQQIIDSFRLTLTQKGLI